MYKDVDVGEIAATRKDASDRVITSSSGQVGILLSRDPVDNVSGEQLHRLRKVATVARERHPDACSRWLANREECDETAFVYWVGLHHEEVEVYFVRIHLLDVHRCPWLPAALKRVAACRLSPPPARKSPIAEVCAGVEPKAPTKLDEGQAPIELTRLEPWITSVLWPSVDAVRWFTSLNDDLRGAPAPVSLRRCTATDQPYADRPVIGKAPVLREHGGPGVLLGLAETLHAAHHDILVVAESEDGCIMRKDILLGGRERNYRLCLVREMHTA